MVGNKECKLLMDSVMDFIRFDSNQCFAIFAHEFTNDEAIQDQYKKGMREIKIMLDEDIKFYLDSDPAAVNSDEIKITYPGFFAIAYYRVAHLLRELGFVIESRIVTEIAHSKTGIDIHPGAVIGVPFFIDHGTGIVIGETAIVGKRVKLYQGVTLGALSLSKGRQLKGTKRHPTIGDDVTIYSNASILGDICIGNDVTIGSNAFVMESVSDHMKVTIGTPILVMKQKDNK